MTMTDEERFRFDFTGPATHNTIERFLNNNEPPVNTDHQV